jgi:pimeloyl-ACP methyl ester carboxylesterase
MKTLYLHGFASGPQSTKGVAFDNHFAAKGRSIERLNLRVPSFEHLRLSKMIEVTRAAIGGPDDRAVLIGSSLGGLTSARVAERDPRVVALVLMAPAFQLAARWRDLLGPAWDQWQTSGWREVVDFTTGKPARVDFGFVEDAEAVDVGYPDVRVPTLILHGTKDDTVPIDRSRTFAQGRDNVRLIELDDGHELVASLPRLLAETESFLDGLRS